MYRSPTLSGTGPLRISKPRSLPHWYRSQGAYFITFRLAGSLPADVLCAAREGLQRWLITHPGADDQALARMRFVSLERVLHDSTDVSFRNEQEYGFVQDALHHFDGRRYHLAAWCVMPNHVHVVLQLCGEHQIDAIVQSWKRFTATRINRLRGVTGALWQKEYFERLIRDDEELGRCIRYTLANPAKGGLRGWRWVGVGSPQSRDAIGMGRRE